MITTHNPPFEIHLDGKGSSARIILAGQPANFTGTGRPDALRLEAAVREIGNQETKL